MTPSSTPVDGRLCDPDRVYSALTKANDLVYSIPNLDNPGFKVAIDAHGPQFEPDTGDRIVSPASLTAFRAHLARR